MSLFDRWRRPSGRSYQLGGSRVHAVETPEGWSLTPGPPRRASSLSRAITFEGEPGYAERLERINGAKRELARQEALFVRATAEAFAIGASRGEARPIWPAKVFPWGEDAKHVDEEMEPDADI